MGVGNDGSLLHPGPADCNRCKFFFGSILILFGCGGDPNKPHILNISSSPVDFSLVSTNRPPRWDCKLKGGGGVDNSLQLNETLMMMVLGDDSPECYHYQRNGNEVKTWFGLCAILRTLRHISVTFK